ncbi:MAG: site-specific integrase [Pseudomonadota bacterium]
MTDLHTVDDDTPPKPPQDGDLIGHIGVQRRRNKDRSFTIYIRWREYDHSDDYQDHTIRFQRSGPKAKQREVRNIVADARHQAAKMEWAKLKGQDICHGRVDYDIQPAAANYLDWLHGHVPRSTYDRREMRLLDLVKWLRVNVPGIWSVKRITYKHLDAYLQDMRRSRDKRPLKNNTIRLALVDIKSWLIFCQKQLWCNDNPCDKVDLPRPDVPKSRFVLPISLVRKILADADADAVLLVRLLFGTGLRIGEAESLRWADFYPADAMLVVPTAEVETNKRHGRMMPLASGLLRRLDVLQDGQAPDSPIFPDAVKTARRVLRRHQFLKRIISPHRCRFWFNHNLKIGGCPKDMRQVLMGHAVTGNLRFYEDDEAALDVDRARGFLQSLEDLLNSKPRPHA